MSSARHFTILTPVLNAAERLPLCCASIRDQDGAAVAHFVLDGGSGDGTVEWLREHGTPLTAGAVPRPGLPAWKSGADRGMYDALNQGIAHARGNWVAWLNADEQYLEGTLAAVGAAAAAHPEADVLFGDGLAVDGEGRCLAWRRSAPPRWPCIAATHLHVPSCTMFFRRRIFDAGFRFDPEWRMVADEEFVVRLLRAGLRFVRIPLPLSAFALTGSNLGGTESARRELQALKLRYPPWIRPLRPALRVALAAMKAACGGFRPPPRLEYALHVKGDAPGRTRFVVEHPSWRWPRAGAS